MNQPLYLVAGLGKTGHSIAGFLSRRNQPFVVFDTRKNVEGLAAFNAEFPGVDVFLGELPTAIYKQLEGIIASPGISLDEPFLQEAFRLNIPVFGDIECLAREIHAPVIAITGTNGKSTVTTLVGEMAKAAGLTVAVAGNIGLPVLDLLDDAQQYDMWVLELSSFQLDLTHSLKPVAATILNVTPDHLDRHHTLEAYTQSKQRIYRNAAFLLYNRDDELTQPLPAYQQANRFNYGLNSPQSNNWGIVEQNGINYLARGEDCFLEVDKLHIKGKHNWQNALAACALASAAGIDRQYIVSVLQSFSGLPHRCQWVRTLDNVDWINDSKGTNIGATISAISGIGGSMQGKIVLIAGGQGKGADFTPLRTPVTDYVRTVVLIGEDADKIANALDDVVPVLRASSLDGAVTLAKQQAKPGDVVLLSPACASFDMFRDFNHRGEAFSHLVGNL
ncbi:UDP-N-acetylmuramoylalanine--D-glutamate ligase [Legionella lansingensis]|uniref:UDP-N-acetylmuramoylalanine--D-glutamate ligase n=1 Tax=Legionella lansingensis TaxID=45067 RepID=A0A0W0VQ04_9GAMM|nr:UDP-N-acetylmuramoyl-L-alanine--D-glutamate ligase [Legionella lansingensis]KTD22193.1 UDP-N-acetylmuramoylalanine--D-glutamate ligase [Legionella lansingensis]SNV54874.1 UDP-N-acetylmuramoylalanine--D-glutamate ligase [Legionella lansingensis]